MTRISRCPWRGSAEYFRDVAGLNYMPRISEPPPTIHERINARMLSAKNAGDNVTAAAIDFLISEIAVQDRKLTVANWRIDGLVEELENIREAALNISPQAPSTHTERGNDDENG